MSTACPKLKLQIYNIRDFQARKKSVGVGAGIGQQTPPLGSCDVIALKLLFGTYSTNNKLLFSLLLHLHAKLYCKTAVRLTTKAMADYHIQPYAFETKLLN